MAILKSMVWGVPAKVIAQFPGFNFSTLERPFDMYWHYLKRARSNGAQVISFVLTEDVPHSVEFDTHMTVPLKLDFIQLEALTSVSEFNKNVIASIHAAFLDLCRSRKWDSKPFDDALSSIEKTAYEFAVYWRSVSWNSDRSVSVQPWVEYGEELCVYADVKYKNGCAEKLLLTKLKGLVQVDCVIQKCEWESISVARIYCEQGRDYWRIDTQNKSSCFVNSKAEAGDPHALYYVGMKYLNGVFLDPDLEKAKFYLQKAAEKGYSRAVGALKKLSAD